MLMGNHVGTNPETLTGKKLYECNPKLNTECDKRMCKYNINAIDRLCHKTHKKHSTMKIGETAAVKDYTPPVEKNDVLILIGETGGWSRQIREKSRVIKK